MDERIYSPLTLNEEWPKIIRLLFMLFCSCFGTLMTGFFVASFFIERDLRKREYIYLACTGVSEMLVTTAIMPASAIILLSGEWDNVNVCRFLQFLGITSTYCYSIFFLLVAANSYRKYYNSSAKYIKYKLIQIVYLCVLVFCLCSVLGAMGAFLGFDYDYCSRKRYGNFYFRITTTVLFHAIPALLTMVFFYCTSIGIRRRGRRNRPHKRSRVLKRDNSLNVTNMFAFLMYVIAWTPYLVITYEFPGTSDYKYYTFVWIGLFRSVLTSFIYGTANISFRRAYSDLFNYCFCKSSLSGPYVGRHRRAGTTDVRVHILHHSVNTTSPLRFTSAIQETRDL